jgi:hypothetical protein
MKFEQAKQIAERAIEQLAESLERGHSEELRRYLTAMAKFSKYSLHNILLILAQRPNVSHVAGFLTWRTLGRRVKRGAKGILILAPIIRRTKSTTETEDESRAQRIAGFRGVYVFDQTDTEGDPLPQFSVCLGDPRQHTEALKAFVLARGAELEYSDRILPAQGQCSPGKIVIVPGLSPAQEFSTLAHEVGHLLLHQTPRRAETTKRVRETEAEAVAFVVCNAIGLESTNASSDHILLYNGDKTLLAESLEHIQQASAEIIRAIVRVNDCAEPEAH